MANQVTQLALITAAIAARMENTLVAAKLISWNMGEKKINPLNGFKYIEHVPPRYNRRRWTGTVTDLSGGKQDTVFGSEIFTLNQGDTLDFFYGDFENIKDFDSAKRNERIRSIGNDEGHLVDAEILKTVTLAGANWIGTPGTAISDVEPLIEGYARLKEEGVADNEIFAVLPYSDMPGLAKYLMELPAPDALATAVVTRLSFKQLAGLPVVFTQQLPVLTTGTRAPSGAAQVDGAAQNVNYRDAAASSTTNGQFLTQLLDIKGLTAGHTVKDGEIFTIAGVNDYDNRKQASKGRLRQFRVVGDYTADGSGLIPNMRIFPAIIVPGGAVTGDTGVNTAHATVTAAPADSAAITWLGAASTDFLTRALVKKSACRVETASLEDLPSGDNASVKMKSIPLSLRSFKYANGDTGVTSVRFDIPWQTNVNPYGRYEIIRVNG
jgi:hypothetical protein